jgi:hypothetical protein
MKEGEVMATAVYGFRIEDMRVLPAPAVTYLTDARHAVIEESFAQGWHMMFATEEGKITFWDNTADETCGPVEITREEWLRVMVCPACGHLGHGPHLCWRMMGEDTDCECRGPASP